MTISFFNGRFSHVHTSRLLSSFPILFMGLLRWLDGNRIHRPMQETQVWSLSQEDPLEKEMATHSSILAWKIPRTEEPGQLQSMRSQRDTTEWLSTHIHIISIPSSRRKTAGWISAQYKGDIKTCLSPWWTVKALQEGINAFQIARRSYWTAQGTLLSVMWQSGWEGNFGENEYMCKYGWVPLLSAWNHHIVNHLYSNTKFKVFFLKGYKFISKIKKWWMVDFFNAFFLVLIRVDKLLFPSPRTVCTDLRGLYFKLTNWNTSLVSCFSSRIWKICWCSLKSIHNNADD